MRGDAICEGVILVNYSFGHIFKDVSHFVIILMALKKK